MSFPVTAAIRATAGVATSLSVGNVISSVIKNNMTPSTKLDAIQMKVAGAALGLVVGTVASTYVENFVGDVTKSLLNVKKRKETTEES